MFRNILVCVDRSPQADRALAQAIDLADCERSRLTLLTAIPRPPSWLGTPLTAGSLQPLADELRCEARDALRRAVESVPNCIPVTTILSEDPIRNALRAELRRGDHDLLVLGTSGRSVLGASLHGSLGAYAVRHCEVPVLMVRADSAPESATARAGATELGIETDVEPLREAKSTAI